MECLTFGVKLGLEAFSILEMHQKLKRKKKEKEKEAEIKVARTALLAIQSNTSKLSDKAVGNSQLTVIPCR